MAYRSRFTCRPRFPMVLARHGRWRWREDLAAAINERCKRYSVALAGVSRDVSMSWDDLAMRAAEPSVTIGSMAVNAPVLTSVKDAAASREMSMGRAVAQSAFHRDI